MITTLGALGLHVAFEGPIAAGKTTLTRLFANAEGARAVLEKFDDNLFLEDFYSSRERWALPMQLSFLMARYGQFREEVNRYDVLRVADHTFAKDRMFARFLLIGRELDLYETIHDGLSGSVAKPDAIVYLDASDAVLLARIKLRGREYEQSIDGRYLDGLRQAYEMELLPSVSVPILRVDTGQLDLTSETELTALFSDVRDLLDSTCLRGAAAQQTIAD